MTIDPHWRVPPPNLILSNQEVHIWRASLDRPAKFVDDLLQLLSVDEIERANRFVFERHRRRFIVARGTLRSILSHYLNVEPHHLQFAYGKRGKPYLSGNLGNQTLYFNLAHSHELALYAFSRRQEIGIDLEQIRPISDIQELAARSFSKSENAVWQMLSPDLKLTAFYNCWTRKEAYIKAIGQGLAHPLEKFDVSLTPGEPARILHIEGEPQEASYWVLQAFVPQHGYAGALAIRERGRHFSYWHWIGEL